MAFRLKKIVFALGCIKTKLNVKVYSWFFRRIILKIKWFYNTYIMFLDKNE